MMSQPRHESIQFRSVLPHEPLPAEPVGYIHIQGSFEPKKKDPEAPNYWNQSEALERVLYDALYTRYESLKLPYPVQSIQIISPDNPPFNKVRLTYDSPAQAIAVQAAWRQHKISPCHLFSTISSNQSDNLPVFSSGSFQVTVVSTIPLPTNPETCWMRSNPPKFRRLLHDHSDQEERSKTRFVYVTGLVPDDSTTSSSSFLESSVLSTSSTSSPTLDTANGDIDQNKNESKIASFWKHPYSAVAAIRNVFNTYDTSNQQVEVFFSKKQQSNGSVAVSCHVGMRSRKDCQRVVQELQGKTVVWDYHGEQQTSGSLFLDYVSITEKSLAKSKARYNGEKEWERGIASRPECTSTTDHVHVPGLLVMEEYVTADQEEVLMAALTGPQAPWAPEQTNKSQTGAVKRLVQHYGYVFDYQTANVLRNRSEVGADCPPMPKCDDITKLDDYVDEGRGWEVLASVIEKTRHQQFAIPSIEGGKEKKPVVTRYPDINQLTLNHYKPGEGIGSHIDTPSAFGDGLIAISLNSGIVMEFRKKSINDNDPVLKKLVYLPRRSIAVMSGPARYEWEHHIVTRSTDTHQGQVLPRATRVSLTLRTALAVDGTTLPLVESNIFPPTWGNASSNSQIKSLVTPATERDHVHAVYDAIATQWHHTRGKRGVLWPGATQFLQRLPQGSVVADCGCGDGKYFPVIIEAGSYVIGTDISRPLLETACRNDEETTANSAIPDLRRVSAERQYLRRRPAVVVADCMSVPLRSKSCDAAICIAVMHHLSTRERRIRCIEELVRIVRVGGTINIQAWAMEQDESSRRRFAGADVFVPFNAQPKYLDKTQGQSQEERDPTTISSQTSNDTSQMSMGSKSVAETYSEVYKKADFDEKKGLVVFQRYCHLYRKGEMEELVQEVTGARLVESGYESGNHFVILEVVD